MIKKIYDRDTGNIYDVGADNKLKLVAEGTLEWDDDNGCYNVNFNVKENKYYLLELHDAGDSLLTHTFCYTSAGFSIPDTFESKWSGVWIKGYGYGNELYLYEQDELTEGYVGVQYKVYELPFSM